MLPHRIIISVRDEIMEQVVDTVYRALSDPNRRAILRILRRGEMSAGAIADELPIAKSTLSGHLNVLKDANLVIAERDGTTIWYRLNIAAYEEIIAAILDLFGVGEDQRTGGD